MDYQRFVNNVADAEGIDSRDKAERAVHATMSVLAGRIGEGEASDLAAQLPTELKDTVTQSGIRLEKLSVDEFFSKVADEARLDDPAEGERYARAVIGTMSEAITRGELTDVFSQLPSEYQELFTVKTL